ncbi:MAG: hypothetical protein IJZ22_05330 [Bacteroidaceae bacterium]|nr:hypothetical protein [Bacteroidaceae bacterium]
MKKIIFTAALFAISLGYATATSETTIEIVKTQTQDTYKVSVCMIKGKGVLISRNTSGIYDSENHRITVEGNTYSVNRNPEYGEDNKKGAYKYVAGGIYYFNL